jgi:prephenate dehydrogenase
MKVGIIGGTGKMGRLFAAVFQRAGHEVMVSGRSTALSDTRLVVQCDLVIVSVPIRETVRVIDRIGPLMSESQILCDLTSLKVGPVEAMLKSKARVIGLHPMFGPTVRTIKQQTIIMCPARADDVTVDTILTIFTNEGAVCTITTPEDHDRMVAIVQGLTHFVTLCMAESVRKMGIDIAKTRAFTSPVYQIELALAGRLLSQDPALYADILQQNPYVPAVLDACIASVNDLREIVGSRDPGKFREFFDNNSRHFGTNCEEGMKMTDALIECMVNR